MYQTKRITVDDEENGLYAESLEELEKAQLISGLADGWKLGYRYEMHVDQKADYFYVQAIPMIDDCKYSFFVNENYIVTYEAPRKDSEPV